MRTADYPGCCAAKTQYHLVSRYLVGASRWRPLSTHIAYTRGAHEDALQVFDLEKMRFVLVCFGLGRGARLSTRLNKSGRRVLEETLRVLFYKVL